MHRVAIIQARMNSTRLPGKAMMSILGKPVLQWMIERVRMSQHIDKIVVATTPNSKEIIRFCMEKKISSFVGDEQNVIKRVCQTAAAYEADIIIDLTSDCPFVSPVMIDNLIIRQARYNHLRSHYSNIDPRSWPDGFDCQVYSAFVLYETENLMAKTDPYREHSGWNILQRKEDLEQYYSMKPIEKYRLPNMRLTLDYREDFIVIKNIIEYFASVSEERFLNCSAEEIIDYVLDNPEILVNKHLENK